MLKRFSRALLIDRVLLFVLAEIELAAKFHFGSKTTNWNKYGQFRLFVLVDHSISIEWSLYV